MNAVLSQFFRPPLRHLFLDWHGTLSTSLFWQSWSVPNHPRRCDFERIREIWKSDLQPLLSQWMRGAATSEQFVATVANHLACDFDELLAQFVASCQSMKLISEDILSLVRGIRARGIRVVIATDNMDCFTRWTVPALGLHANFDDILCSHELAVLKADTDDDARSLFFAPYIDQHRVEEGTSLLLDDSVSNHAVATASGIRYRQVTSGASLVDALT